MFSLVIFGLLLNAPAGTTPRPFPVPVTIPSDCMGPGAMQKVAEWSAENPQYRFVKMACTIGGGKREERAA